MGSSGTGAVTVRDTGSGEFALFFLLEIRMLQCIHSSLRRWFDLTARPARRALPSRRFRPLLELLEDRVTPVLFVGAALPVGVQFLYNPTTQALSLTDLGGAPATTVTIGEAQSGAIVSISLANGSFFAANSTQMNGILYGNNTSPATSSAVQIFTGNSQVEATGGVTGVTTLFANVGRDGVVLQTIGGLANTIVNIDVAAASSIDVQGEVDTSSNTSGQGNITLCAATSIVIEGTGSLNTDGAAGNVTLKANVNGVNNTGPFVDDGGIAVLGAISTASGNVCLQASGGSVSGVGQPGIAINAGAVLAGNSGTVTLSGISGITAAGDTGLPGVAITNGGMVTTQDGALQITGQGTGPGDDEIGIAVNTGGAVAATGAGTVSLHGTGGNGVAGNDGIDIDNAQVLTNTGNLSLTGVGKGTGADNLGIVIDDGAEVAAANTTIVFQLPQPIGVVGIGGNGGITHPSTEPVITVPATPPNLTLFGTGGNGTSNDTGVSIGGADTLVMAGGGNVSVTGSGQGSGQQDVGIDVDDGATLSAAGAGNLAMKGTGSTGSGSFNDGIDVADNGNGTSVTTADGTLQMTGTALASAAASFGISVNTGAAVAALGMGQVSLTGSDNSVASSAGIDVDGPDTQVSTAGGNLTMTGFSKGISNTGTSTDGISVQGGAAIAAAGAGNVTLTGTSSLGAASDTGVALEDIGTVVSTIDGSVSITGTGRGEGAMNQGVVVNKALVEANGLGGVSLTGTGGNGTSGDNGVSITASEVRTTVGNLSITATAGSGTGSTGLIVDAAATVFTGASGALTLEGTGGGGLGSDGVAIAGSAHTADGALEIIGTTNTLAADDAGVAVSSGDVFATGIGNVTLTGSGSVGVQVSGFGAQVAATNGNLLLTGTGKLFGGVTLTNGAAFDTLGSGNITLSTDSLFIDNSGSSIDAGNNLITLQPVTSGWGIGLVPQGTSVGGSLNITDPELETLTAGTVQIGNTSSGNIEVIGTITLHPGFGELDLVTGGTITTYVGSSIFPAGLLQAGTLVLSAGAGIGTAAVPLQIQANTVAASVGSGAIFVNNVGALTVETMTAATAVTVTATGNLTVAGRISNTGRGGAIVLSTLDPTGTGQANIAVQKTATITTAGGNITLQAGDNLTISAGASITSYSGFLLAAGPITLAVDAGNTNAGVGGVADIEATVLTGGSITIEGNAASTTNDQFTVAPSATTPITVDGGGGTDNVLSVLTAGTTGAALNATNSTSGSATFTSGGKTVTYKAIAAASLKP